jgi:hypothetical protein
VREAKRRGDDDLMIKELVPFPSLLTLKEGDSHRDKFKTP